MKTIDLAGVRQTPLQREPFAWLRMAGFVRPDALADICASYPALKGGSYPLENLELPPSLRALVEEMDSPEFEAAMAEKFALPLEGKPKYFSLRGYCRRKDGKIHTDSRDKIITLLVYFHESWEHAGGRLRLLRNGRDMEDAIAEISPAGGTLLAFRRSDNSWHGHPPYEGVRRALQMNWLRDESARGVSRWRHRLSSWWKG